MARAHALSSLAQLCPQGAELLVGERLQEMVLVAEMDVKGRLRDPGGARDRAHRERAVTRFAQ